MAPAKASLSLLAKWRHEKITGNFEISPSHVLLEKLSPQLADLYFDGRLTSIYDASEMRNAGFYATSHLTEFNNFLKRSGLYNKNYPLRMR